MPFDWKEYLQTAEHLKSLGGESSFRSGVSRAYYSAYGVCFAYAKNTNYITESEIKTQGPKMHKFLAARLKQDSDKDLRRIGYSLDTLRLNRNFADYDAKKNEFKTAAPLIAAITLANQLSADLKNYKESQP